MQEFDILSIGDSTIDVFMEVDPQDAEKVCDKNDTDCKVCFSYASKIPVTKMTRVAAVGNAANNAIGSARLGLNTAIYTVLGSDHDSEESRSVFEQEGVDTSLVIMESGKRSNFSTVINYSGERTIFVYHEPRQYKLPQVSAPWAYLTSVGREHENLHKEVLDWVKSNNVKLGFNPGSHQLRDGLEGLRALFEVTEILSVNREEAHGLVDPPSFTASAGRTEVRDLIMELKKIVPGIVVITDGPQGSYASFDGREIWFVGIPDSEVLERTGAGDGYTTAFIAAISQGKEIPEAMVWGTMNASSVVQHVGAREGLLNPLKMREWIEKYESQVKPRMI